MEEALYAFPFRKLSCKYHIIEIIMHIDRSQALHFMFEVNKQTRSFLHKHYK